MSRILERGSREEQDAMFAYEQSVNQTASGFVDYASGQVSLGKPYGEQRNELLRMRRSYTTMMLFLCFMPLSKGVRPQTVMQSAGVYLSCMLFSDVFREEAGETIRNTFLSCVESRVDRDERIGFTDEESDWLSQRKRVREADRKEDVVWTPDSAAMMQLAYWKRMYEDARSEACDLEALHRQYQAKVDALYAEAGDDGISVAKLESRTQYLAGLLEQKDAESYACFKAYKEQLANVQMQRNLRRLPRVDWEHMEPEGPAPAMAR